MNTLLLSPELFLAEGGIARIMRLYLLALCSLAKPTESVDLLVLNDESKPDPRLSRYSNGKLRHQVGCNHSRFRFLWHTLRLAKKNDLLICGHLHQLPLAWLAQRFDSRLKYCLIAHGIEVWRPYSAMERHALAGAQQIFCVSDYTRRQMRRFCPGLPAKKLTVIPNTLDPYFMPDPSAPVSAVPFAGPRILSVTRLTSTDAYKGVDTLIEALPQFRREFPFVQLRVIGQGDDLPRLLALAARLGVINAVTFTGGLTDEALRNEYASCDFFALPSQKEGFGLVYLEAMTHGKPCLGARAGGVPEVINDTVGRLVSYGNISDLIDGLVDLVRHPRDADIVRRHAATFAFPTFQRRLASALS